MTEAGFRVSRLSPAEARHWARLRADFLREDSAVRDIREAEVAVIEEWLNEHDGRGFIGVLAWDGQDAVAAGGVTLFPVPPAPGRTGVEAHVMSMYTRPDHRRRGAARQVLDELVRLAGEAGASRVWLRATDENRELYAASGFRPRDDAMELVLYPDPGSR